MHGIICSRICIIIQAQLQKPSAHCNLKITVHFPTSDIQYGFVIRFPLVSVSSLIDILDLFCIARGDANHPPLIPVDQFPVCVWHDKCSY